MADLKKYVQKQGVQIIPRFKHKLTFFSAAAPEENLEAATATDPILLLDQEQINRLENVLRSEEAKDILGDVLSNAGKYFRNENFQRKYVQ